MLMRCLVTQNLEWGVSVGYGERNNVALCASRAGKTNRFPWKEIMFRLHLRRPHKADQRPVCCVEQAEEEEEEEKEEEEEEKRIWTATQYTHTDTPEGNADWALNLHWANSRAFVLFDDLQLTERRGSLELVALLPWFYSCPIPLAQDV
ncbi:hypothetical protein EYF80_040517 [Liparis tanakae]|uniref:Uncharacterized protein n=1 Tax=Liparis tanakae TaxID=230148 RepID=A0A4Z2G822_9TELE|nr:hypothetical protein EYF80_040517 [Liparis tanakae]